MLRGLYAAASAMVAQVARQEVYANNLANANSVGFRRGQAVMGSFEAALAEAATGGAAASPAPVDLSQGPVVTTGRSLDLAITGDAFFTVQTPQGLACTRDGRFQLDAGRGLVTLSGHPVLGTSGPIVLPSTDFTVSTSGEVSCGGIVVDTLRLQTPQAPRPLGEGLYSATQARPPQAAAVTQGALEHANVNGMQEMGRMMSGYRLYEANATALRYQDESLNSLMRIVQ